MVCFFLIPEENIEAIVIPGPGPPGNVHGPGDPNGGKSDPFNERILFRFSLVRLSQTFKHGRQQVTWRRSGIPFVNQPQSTNHQLAFFPAEARFKPRPALGAFGYFGDDLAVLCAFKIKERLINRPRGGQARRSSRLSRSRMMSCRRKHRRSTRGPPSPGSGIVPAAGARQRTLTLRRAA
jgi:hypothetical protein